MNKRTKGSIDIYHYLGQHQLNTNIGLLNNRQTHFVSGCAFTIRCNCWHWPTLLVDARIPYGVTVDIVNHNIRNASHYFWDLNIYHIKVAVYQAGHNFSKLHAQMCRFFKRHRPLYLDVPNIQVHHQARVMFERYCKDGSPLLDHRNRWCGFEQRQAILTV
jgi:hypothetical protein